MKYLVTGASGLIGKALCKHLSDSGHLVTAVMRSEPPAELCNRDSITILRGDVQNPAFLKIAMDGIDRVFHVAAYTQPWARDPSAYERINVDGTKNVCEAARFRGVRRVVITASAGIHGPQIGDKPVGEEQWPSSYHTPYELSKFNALRVAMVFNDNSLEVNAVSPARVYSPGEVSTSNVPARLAALYLKAQFGVVPANGLGIGCYTYIDDVVKGHMLAMETKQAGEEYLIGGENANYIQFYNTLRQVSGLNYPVFKIPYHMSLVYAHIQLQLANRFGVKPTITPPWVKKYTMNWGVDATKISALGYRHIPLAEGLGKLVARDQTQI